MVTATVRVTRVEVDQQLRDRFQRWLVTADVVGVDEGELTEGEITVLVHSPSRDLMHPEPVGRLFRWTLTDGGSSPFRGLLQVENLPEE